MKGSQHSQPEQQPRQQPQPAATVASRHGRCCHCCRPAPALSSGCCGPGAAAASAAASSTTATQAAGPLLFGIKSQRSIFTIKASRTAIRLSQLSHHMVQLFVGFMTGFTGNSNASAHLDSEDGSMINLSQFVSESHKN